VNDLGFKPQMNTDIKDLNKLEFRSVLLRVHLWPIMNKVRAVVFAESSMSIPLKRLSDVLSMLLSPGWKRVRMRASRS